MRYNFRIISTYSPRTCGIAAFSRNLGTALGNLTAESRIPSVAAIDNEGLQYYSPVDLTINQNDWNSWRATAGEMIARVGQGEGPTYILLQHEYGLDGENSKGNNFVMISGMFREARLPTLTYLHTVLSKPDDLDLIKEAIDESPGKNILKVENNRALLSQQGYLLDAGAPDGTITTWSFDLLSGSLIELPREIGGIDWLDNNTIIYYYSKIAV